MSDPYTPSTKEVAEKVFNLMGYAREDAPSTFMVLADYLATHDAQVRAEAWDEGMRTGWDHSGSAKYSDVQAMNPHRALPTSPPPTLDAETEYKNAARVVKIGQLRQARVTVDARRGEEATDD